MQNKNGKAPKGAISAEPYACKQTTAFVRNANPIQNASILEMGRFVASIKKAIARQCAMAFLAPATGIEPITNP